MKHCLQSLGKNFTVKECSLGTDPHEVLPKEGVYEHVRMLSLKRDWYIRSRTYLY